MGLGQMMSLNPEFAACRASAWAVLEIITRKPEIDGSEEAPGAFARVHSPQESLTAGLAGLRVPIEGHVRLRNLRFTFPSRPTDEVLRGINLDIPAGMCAWLVHFARAKGECG